MKLERTAALGMAVVFCLAGGAVFADHHEITMKGSFVWARSDKEIPGDIEAVFTPAGKKAWDVVFHFEWEGEMRAWKGTAQGDLKKGKLEGEATEDRDRERTFVFKGTTKDGVFKGEHGSMSDGELESLGTITLEAP